MYPRSPAPNAKASSRDQLSELLLNKFRNRYNIKMASERDLDSNICREVQKLVKRDASVTERDLNELDRCIKDLVHKSRNCGPEPHKDLTPSVKPQQ